MSEQVLYPPMPDPDEVTAFFWEGVEQHKLLVARCTSCGTYHHPPKGHCSVCSSLSIEPVEVSGRATLVTWTQPMKAYEPFFESKVPYFLATVNLVEQEPLRFATNLVDCTEDDLRIDLPLEVTFREVAPGCTLPLFRPA